MDFQFPPTGPTTATSIHSIAKRQRSRRIRGPSSVNYPPWALHIHTERPQNPSERLRSTGSPRGASTEIICFPHPSPPRGGLIRRTNIFPGDRRQQGKEKQKKDRHSRSAPLRPKQATSTQRRPASTYLGAHHVTLGPGFTSRPVPSIPPPTQLVPRAITQAPAGAA